MPGGEVKWTTPNSKRPTQTVESIRRMFRDVVLGLDYRSYFLVGVYNPMIFTHHHVHLSLFYPSHFRARCTATLFIDL